MRARSGSRTTGVDRQPDRTWPPTGPALSPSAGDSPYDVTFAAGAAWVTNYGDSTVSLGSMPGTNRTRTITVGSAADRHRRGRRGDLGL